MPIGRLIQTPNVMRLLLNTTIVGVVFFSTENNSRNSFGRVEIFYTIPFVVNTKFN